MVRRVASVALSVLVVIVVLAVMMRRRYVAWPEGSAGAILLDRGWLPYPANGRVVSVVAPAASRGRRIALLSDGFENSPALILPGRCKGSAYILYHGDVMWLLLSVADVPCAGAEPPFPLDGALMWIVPESTAVVGVATLDEARSCLEMVKRSPEEVIRKAEVPTIDVGLARTYVPKKNLLRGLSEIVGGYSHLTSPALGDRSR